MIQIGAYVPVSATVGDLTLAGFSASDSKWEEIEPAWKDKLRSHGLDYFHWSEAYAGKDHFEGWDVPRVNALVTDLMNFLGRFRSYSQHTDDDLLGFSCTVDLAAYRRLREAKEINKSAEALCVDWCAGLQFERKPDPEPGYLALFFDRNEEFLDKIHRVWNRKSSKRPFWAHWISTIAPVSMQDSPALQMADLLAGALARHHKTRDFWWALGMK